MQPSTLPPLQEVAHGARASIADGVALADDPPSPSAPGCPSVCPPKYETFCRANGVIVAVIDWGRGEGGREGRRG